MAISKLPNDNDVLADFRREFGQELYDIRDKHKNETEERLKQCFETVPDLDDRFKAMQQLLRSGIFAWRGSLTEFVKREVLTLAQIAPNDSQSYSEPGQRVDWACVEVEQLLEKGLGQEISIDESALEDWRPAAITNHRLSAVENWSKWVCGGEEEFAIKPWTAPAWYDLFLRPKFWIMNGRPERISAEMTARATTRYQMLLVGNLEADLERAKRRARIELASRDRLVRPDKSRPDIETPPQVSVQSTVRLAIPISEHAKNSRDGLGRLIVFTQLKDGKFLALPPINDADLLNTYEQMLTVMEQVRTFLLRPDSEKSIKALSRNFARTPLGKIATDKDWELWIDDFVQNGATAKAATLVFLEAVTGLNRITLKTRLSRKRSARRTVNTTGR